MILNTITFYSKHPVSCMLPKAQRPVVVSEDFLKIGSRSNDYPTKIQERSSSAASGPVADNSRCTEDRVRNFHGKGESVPFEGTYGRLEAGPTDLRKSKGDLRRLGVYGLDLWQHPVCLSSKIRDRLLDSSPRTRLLSLDREASQVRHPDWSRPGWNEKTRIERSSVDEVSKVRDGKVQGGSTATFNKMIHFREKLSLLQQQQQQQQQILRESSDKERLAVANRRESKNQIHPIDEKRSGHGNEDRQDEASLPIFPPAKGHDPHPQRAPMEKGISGQKKLVAGGCSEGGKDCRFCVVLQDNIWSRNGSKCWL